MSLQVGDRVCLPHGLTGTVYSLATDPEFVFVFADGDVRPSAFRVHDVALLQRPAPADLAHARAMQAAFARE